MPVHLINQQHKPNLLRPATMRARAEKLLLALGKEDCELSLVLTNDAEIQELNREWRKKDKATDVLSFPQGDGPLLGDVVISSETALRQSGDESGWARTHAGISGEWMLLDEATLLLIHGVLHLLGHDHHRAADAKKMRAEEARLFATISRRRSSTA